MNKTRFLTQAFAALSFAFFSSAALAVPYSSFVVFGDSLSDPGNDFAITTGNDPTKPFPPPPYFQGHFSNGLTAAEIVTLRTGLPTQNFAQGGATTGTLNIDDGRCIPTRDCLSPGNYQLQAGLLSGIQTQVAGFLAATPADVSTTLFFLQGGANDFFTNDPAIIAQIVPNLFGQVSALIAAGAQHIALANVPNIAVTPLGQALAPAQRAVLEAGLAQVNAGIAQVWAGLPDVVIPVDLFDVVNDAVDDPATYGFTNTNVPCIALPSCDGAAFFDDVHPTTALHAIAAQRIIAAAIPEPSVLVLFALGALGLWRRRAA
jgi:outer membrane lipase/esterase